MKNKTLTPDFLITIGLAFIAIVFGVDSFSKSLPPFLMITLVIGFFLTFIGFNIYLKRHETEIFSYTKKEKKMILILGILYLLPLTGLYIVFPLLDHGDLSLISSSCSVKSSSFYDKYVAIIGECTFKNIGLASGQKCATISIKDENKTIEETKICVFVPFGETMKKDIIVNPTAGTNYFIETK